MNLAKIVMSAMLALGLLFSACKKEEINLKPKAGFSVDNENPLIDEEISFTDASSDEDGSIASWEWTFGDGNISTAQNPKHTYTNKGTYTVGLTVTDNLGEVASATKDITVTDPADLNQEPVALFSLAKEVFLAGNDVSFTDGSSDSDGSIQSWSWDFGDGSSSTDQNPVHIYSEIGEYAVSLEVTDNFGASSSFSDTVKIGGIKWAFPVGAKIESTTPAIGDDGTVFVSLSGKEGIANMHAISSEGTELWSYEVGDIVRSSPVIASNGNVYLSSYDDYFYSFNPSTGDTVWSFKVGQNAKYSTPAIGTDGSIYIGLQSDNVHALNPDGTEKWVFPTGGDVNGSPVIGADGTVYIHSTDDFLYALDPASGTEKWKYEYGSWAGTALALAEDGTIYLAGELDATTGVVAAVNPNGTEKWKVSTNGKIDQGGPAVGPDGTVYVGTKGPELLALDPANGSQKWSYTNALFAGIGSTPAIDAQGNVYFGDDSGIFTVLDAQGNVKFELNLGAKIWSSVAFDDKGVIYIGASQADDTGAFYAIELFAGTPPASWCMRHGNRRNSGNIAD